MFVDLNLNKAIMERAKSRSSRSDFLLRCCCVADAIVHLPTPEEAKCWLSLTPGLP